ncbi:dihydroneopterin aldolase [Iodobacter sp.]|uniref:dihydroneopterin aldolase n=1 Tax=Iodobacter sp. TaxID=1915058 RepID=UPI0025E31FDC|nr:dihydroneopterin aldolase [Iodobacter sp.]
MNLLLMKKSKYKETRILYVEEYISDAYIGIYENEKKNSQRVKISVSVIVKNIDEALNDNFEFVLDYSTLREIVIDVLHNKHTELQETVCDRIAERCLSFNDVIKVCIKIGKLDAFNDCHAIGCILIKEK